MSICAIGTGYAGLVTGTVFADRGDDVICVDRDRAKIEGPERELMPIYEHELEEMGARDADNRRLAFATEADEAIPRSELAFALSALRPSNPASST